MIPLGEAWDREEFCVLPPMSPAMTTAPNMAPKPFESRETARQFAMNYQNAFASRTIQKYWRGWWARLQLWKWGGVMLKSRALKIQRTWRGRMGRKRALIKAKERLANIANRIKGQYFIWLAKRKLRVLRAENIERQVTMIQCLYRTRLARDFVRMARFRHHTRMATRIQSIARGRLGRRRYKGFAARLKAVFTRMSMVMREDVKKSQAHIKPTMESLAGETNRSNAWELLESVMFHSIGTIRRDVALDLAVELVLKYPDFPYGRFALQTCLFLTFTCSGSTNHVRMDMLDELIGCLYYGQNAYFSPRDFNYHRVSANHRRPEMARSDPPAQFGWEDPYSGAMDEIEYMYFRNAFLRHGKSAHSMSVMAACALMRMHVSDWDTDRTAGQSKQLSRARKLLINAANINTNNKEEALSRVEVMEHVFGRAHRVLLRNTIQFDGLKMLGYKAFNMLHQQHKIALKDSMKLHIEVVRCGEVFIVRGTLQPLPVSLDDVKKSRKNNKIPAFQEDSETGSITGVDMAPKWTSYTKSYEDTVSEFQESAKEAAVLVALEEEDGDDDGLIPNFEAPPDLGRNDSARAPPDMLRNDSTGGYSTGSNSLGSLESHERLDEDGDDGNHNEDGTETAKAKSVSMRRKKEKKPEEHPYLPPLIVRPMVLNQREVISISEIALSKTALDRGVTEEELQAEMGMHSILAQYLMSHVRVSTCRSRLVLSEESAQMVSLKLSLPQIEYRRLEQNNARTVDYSIKLIQRIYRGSRGKHRFRRIWFRSKEKLRQDAALAKKLELAKGVRDRRCLLICKIQASVKAWSWRRLMARMRRAATMFQCMVRCFIARNTVGEERRRKTMGPEVNEMARKSVEVGDLKFTLIVYRCGAQYKLLGYDLLQTHIYEGIVLQDEVAEMCSAFNAALTGTPLQIERQKLTPLNTHRVVELMIQSIGVSRAMPSATTTLGAIPEQSERKRYILVMKPHAEATLPGLTTIKNLRRVLKDTQGVVAKYEKMLAKETKQRSQGLLAADEGLSPTKKKRSTIKSLECNMYKI
jgi:hypothetical protein